ncbi:hypothetical protein FC093_20140 [Ilyomonas limi]|uniref:Uncharacterized protein n=1 Tax=Ilyomonas limi TaxID=2575867 RepID=A0A4V5UVM5_9BACT|nr:hypothetical protein [Ilyomonas limi]TKK65423.1 hypothetical protein FC093_20140 [Ilyomonas limi]
MAEKIPIVDLNNELLIHIGGEATKKHSIPWDMLRNVGDKLQALLITLAKYSLDQNEVVNLNNVTIDFTGFYQGSAVPSWSLNRQPVPTLFDADDILIKSLSKDFSRLMYNVDKGNYQAIADAYNTNEVKNEVVTKVFDFTNAAGTAPIQIVRRKKNNKGFAKIYNIRRLKKEVYEQLIAKDKNVNLVANTPDQTAVGKIVVKTTKSGRLSKKPSEIYPEKEAVLSLKLEQIVTLERKYLFNAPVFFQFYPEGKGIIIENEQLDLFAAGKSLEEAKFDLFQQFDFSYQRFSQLEDEKLSLRLRKVKTYYKLIVKDVING